MKQKNKDDLEKFKADLKEKLAYLDKLKKEEAVNWKKGIITYDQYLTIIDRELTHITHFVNQTQDNTPNEHDPRQLRLIL